MRTPIIAGNWKMNKNPKETTEFVNAVKADLPASSKVESVIGAPAVDLQALLDAAKGSELKVAAENCYFEDEGAFTGETSPKVLSEMGVDYVIIGHSERRQYFKETDKDINKKAKAIFANNMLPIICCGETLEQREAGQTNDWVSGQITNALKGLSAEQVASLVIAYEPIWAIGTGKTASSDQAQEVCHVLRETVAKLYDQTTADKVRIQYGGSVKPANVKELMGKDDIDGGLVGGASLVPESFLELVKFNA
ncbi:triose-phosphate isomerase [Pediococcus ethanolidurans]|uniref:triose-phosphate isomerase n=1 Tax=Pediococcus ethanolidurans TaxID=319653 RepID=UPI001C1EBE9B|nr:triose-phosphate isomerase [Pediococcus ethanolidurans]MBU7555804.1 triose-phosphate isomerase [Pediococcus ethanolidurans]MCT4398553.1 triose-phosphate isomerase [Pediococcus ethanolidurans]MCV3323908.1 triose-phosphate isomerase [Pediococcus ethanolidurans]MCV3327070.1 triose-phosphate isomerase [Pediococcus ethanolidurans]MCV3555985.1 triose-phosphate isomerase [Pediococcus ethanolidurans]